MSMFQVRYTADDGFVPVHAHMAGVCLEDFAEMTDEEIEQELDALVAEHYQQKVMLCISDSMLKQVIDAVRALPVGEEDAT